MLLKMVIEYCQCAEELPMLAPDLTGRLVELLKVIIYVVYCLLHLFVHPIFM